MVELMSAIASNAPLEPVRPASRRAIATRAVERATLHQRLERGSTALQHIAQHFQRLFDGRGLELISQLSGTAITALAAGAVAVGSAPAPALAAGAGVAALGSAISIGAPMAMAHLRPEMGKKMGMDSLRNSIKRRAGGDPELEKQLALAQAQELLGEFGLGIGDLQPSAERPSLSPIDDGIGL
jgi:hypothetical protein